MADDLDMTEPPGLADEEELDDEFDVSEVGKEKDLTGDGGVIKKILVEGSGWETPSKGDEVTVHYVGTLEDGTVFDSSRERDTPFVFSLGQGRVIKGWDEGVKTFKKGEKALLTCKADYAYGEQGSPPKIPPNATLNFEVELLSWKSVKDIAGDGGVIKTILTEGSGWTKPKDQDEALVRYTVRVGGSDGASVASSSADGDVISVASCQLKAFQVALKTMKEGEKVTLHIKPEYGYSAEGRPEGVPADAELEADLELVLIRKVETATDDGQVSVKLIKKGKNYRKPNEGATVKVAYTARIGGPDGPVFEEYSREAPLTFIADEGEVVEGLDLGVLKMNEDEVMEIRVAPEYGFGDKEEKRPLGTVPPNSTLLYTVELLEVIKAKESWDMSAEDKVQAAQKRKELGNKFFKAEKWSRAAKKYKAAGDIIDHDKDFSTELKKESAALKKSANLNTAAAYIKQGLWKDAIAAANKVLNSNPSDVKALYRRAQAHLGQQDFVEALVDIKAALQVEPANKDVRVLLARYKKESAAANQRDAVMYKTMFQKLAKLPDKGPKVQSKAGDPEVLEDAEAPSTSDSENKPEAANGLETKQQNGHAEATPAAAPVAEPMAVDN
ncbi:Peptidyl-prolyl cis-trans isomerase FKBP62 [Coccomyxa sp. Obi]|nr:Peptidyl-prolyl cis-trans isomerase FKBP62 [Coccomyxa sp. Obi]